MDPAVECGVRVVINLYAAYCVVPGGVTRSFVREMLGDVQKELRVAVNA
jgi:hypothetical protein